MRWPVETQRRQERVEDALALLARSDVDLEYISKCLRLAEAAIDETRTRNRAAQQATMLATGYEYRRTA